MSELSPEAIARNPEWVTKMLELNSGEQFQFRLLRPNDGALLGRYFEGLSQETRRRYGPHPLTMEEAYTLCANIDYHHILRLLAVVKKDKQLNVIAYFVLILRPADFEKKRFQEYGTSLNGQQYCTFAPSVADAYQNHGLGSAMMPEVIDLLRRLDLQQVVLLGGTQATNYRAIHFFEKFGFRKVGDFDHNGNNHDMTLELF